ncbi:hypothetical protein SG34_032385 [Thalassomonas viridans]|uniref:Uncharacterized protein n=1 Tax=Thalassomonas viridans TaxID=137584 RepID=A0AAE9Z8B7_9GAMM|nr:hypothetical protein [Thalassomonas viridans]WDE08620.1 hypothetical protein SG34_032385 [Thalassomonas viridans]
MDNEAANRLADKIIRHKLGRLPAPEDERNNEVIKHLAAIAMAEIKRLIALKEKKVTKRRKTLKVKHYLR